MSDHTLPLSPAHLAAFGPDFVWGVATSAFQIEGASTEDGRGASIWDTFCAQPGKIADGSDGSVACDHYHRLEADLDLIAGLGVDAYRFSVAWPRVQPLGSGDWNPPGLAFYDRLVDGLLARGIRPYLTLNHWDLPEALQQQGGWAARATVDHFVAYARGIARHFAGRVVSIATHNEPWVVAILGNETGIFAPGIQDRAVAMQVAHHLLLSHGKALQALRVDGCAAELGIVLNLAPIHAASEAPEDLAAARLSDGRLLRWFMDPLFRGAYPTDVLEHLGADAPQVLPGDLELICQPMDFLGVNYYSRSVVGAAGLVEAKSLGNPLTDMDWEIYPAGLDELLQRLHRDYPLPAVYITENGAAFADQCHDGRVRDTARVDYLARHLEASANAILAGVPLRGYMVWSLLDNFEWASGYLKRFGIVHVDYATQQRTLKDSALWYRDFLHGQHGRSAA